MAEETKTDLRDDLVKINTLMKKGSIDDAIKLANTTGDFLVTVMDAGEAISQEYLDRMARAFEGIATKLEVEYDRKTQGVTKYLGLAKIFYTFGGQVNRVGFIDHLLGEPHLSKDDVRESYNKLTKQTTS